MPSDHFGVAGTAPLRRKSGCPQMCCCIKFRRPRSNRFGTGRGFQKIQGTLESRPNGMWAWLTLRNAALHHLHNRAKFGHSRSSHMSTINGDLAEKN